MNVVYFYQRVGLKYAFFLFLHEKLKKGQKEGKLRQIRQDTVVLWSNSSCIRSGGQKFESRRRQILGEKWNNGLETYDWVKNETMVWKHTIGWKMIQRSWNKRLGEKWNNGPKRKIGWKMKQQKSEVQIYICYSTVTVGHIWEFFLYIATHCKP